MLAGLASQSNVIDSMQQEINDVTEAIQESNLQLLEYENTLRQLKWDRFDYLQDRISQVTKEADFLNDLLSEQDLYEDNGQFNEYGEAAMGLHGVNYNTYMAQADMYAEELKAVSQELANDPYNTVLVERYEELLGLQQDAIRGANEEKAAIVELVEEGINRELDALNELIDKRKEQLDAEKSLYDYEREMREGAGTVSKLEKELSAYSGDESEENRARLQQLRDELASAKEDLAENEYEHYIDEQEKMLSDLYDDYEAVLMERLDNTDALISDMIDRINENASGIMDTLATESDKVGYTMTDAMSSIWSASGDFAGVITQYGDGFLNAMTSLNDVLGRIEGYVSSMAQSGDNIAEGSIQSATPETQTAPSSPQPTPQPPQPTPPPQTQEKQEDKEYGKVKVVKGQWYVRTGPSMSYKKLGIAHTGDTLEYRGETRGTWFAVRYKDQDAWMSSKGSKLVGYSTGGIVGDMKRVAARNGDDVVTVNTLKKGEAILTPDQTQMFSKFTNYLPQLSGIVDNSGRFRGMSAPQGNSGLSIGNVSFNIPIDHVEDYDDFVRQIQRDDKFEKLIQSMTLDRMTGGGKLSKYKVKW